MKSSNTNDGSASTSTSVNRKVIRIDTPEFDKEKVSALDGILTGDALEALMNIRKYKDLLFYSQAFFYLETKEIVPGNQEIDLNYSHFDILYRFFGELEDMIQSTLIK